MLFFGPKGLYWDEEDADGAPIPNEKYKTTPANERTETMRKFEDFNWAGNTTFIDTAKMSLEALLSANQKSWETVAQSTVTWKTALDITEFVNTDPIPDTEIGIIAQNIGDIYTLAYAQMVQAKSDEAVLSALKTAKRTPKKRGLLSCLNSEPKNGRKMLRKSTRRNKTIYKIL